MTPSEEGALRNLYAQWTTERLVRASTTERTQYQPGAIPLMLAELEQRGVAADALPDLVCSLPPTVVQQGRDTRFRPARLARKQYLLRWLVWAMSLVVVGVLLSLIPAIPSEIFLGGVFGALVYKILGMDIPRMKDAGLSPWLLLLLAVPVANLGIVVLLFVAPSEK